MHVRIFTKEMRAKSARHMTSPCLNPPPLHAHLGRRFAQAMVFTTVIASLGLSYLFAFVAIFVGVVPLGVRALPLRPSEGPGWEVRGTKSLPWRALRLLYMMLQPRCMEREPGRCACKGLLHPCSPPLPTPLLPLSPGCCPVIGATGRAAHRRSDPICLLLVDQGAA